MTPRSARGRPSRKRKREAAPIPTLAISIDTVDHLKDFIPLDRVPNFLPPLRGDRPVNVSTIYRWTIDGCRGVKLRYLTLASKRFTTREWLAEFLSRINGQPAVDGGATPQSTPRRPPEDPSIDRGLDRFKV
jgi:hypothetical protein